MNDLRVTYRKIDSLKPYKNNVKLHPDSQLKMIADSIERFGFTNPLLITKDYEIIAGHGRLLAAQRLGMSEVPTILLNDLTPDEIKAYRVADNKLVESDWDEELLVKELKGLERMTNYSFMK
ncbi:MAG: ParB/Srx family N-terminal domain-containing protein [Candidatus Nanoarchaeia archaeon]|jgi:ParB-like chromosome segregation protein Spo0J